MTRILSASRSALALAALSFGADDPDPPKLKRVERPSKEEQGPPPRVVREGGDPKDEPEAPLPAGEDAKKVLERVSKNMRSSEDRLNAKDPGNGTQQLQRDIVKDLDSLIEEAKKQQQQQQSSSSSSSSSSSKNSKGQQQASERQKQRQQEQANKQKQGQGQGEKDQSATKSGSGTEGGRGGASETGMNKIADLYKDIWGHLPETMRQELDAYARESFMLRYQDLVRQYYATIAEKGRKPAEANR